MQITVTPKWKITVYYLEVSSKVSSRIAQQNLVGICLTCIEFILLKIGAIFIT